MVERFYELKKFNLEEVESNAPIAVDKCDPQVVGDSQTVNEKGDTCITLETGVKDETKDSK